MNIYRLRRWLTLAILPLAVTSPVRAQEPAAIRRIGLPSLDSQVCARLLALDRKLNLVHSPALAVSMVSQLTLPASPLLAFTPILSDARNLDIWEQLPEDYRRLMQESGDALLPQVEAPAGAAWSAGQTRRLCQQRLASLPRACLESYRQGVDAEAKALLDEGRGTRAPAPLRRLVDEMFCSSVGDQALDLLGDLAFERGHFTEARYWWNLLAPLAGDTSVTREDHLQFPDPKVDIVGVQAKQVLAMIFQGRHEEARRECQSFAKRHPRARGALAGQDDRYSAILQRTLTAFVTQRLANNDEAWPTFGGDGARNHALTLGLDWHLWVDGATWRVKLPENPASRAGVLAVPDRWSLNRRAAHHPVIINSQVLIADHRSVVSYHLVTGKELFRFDLKTAGLQDVAAGGLSETIRLPRFTLSADRERAYVRLGRQGLSAARKGTDNDGPSYLICLDITQPERKKPRLLWHITAGIENKTASFFEGSPLVREGRIYMAVSTVVNRRTTTSIVCYDVAGKPRWSREVCECPEFEDRADAPRHRQHLLTWAGGQVVYASNAGAIAAVDAWTGQPTWGVRYPTRGPLLPDAEPSPRDLAPCVYAEGRIFAAPLDTDRLFCLDATTGQVHWELDRVDIVQLLGVAHGRVVMTTRTGVLAVDAANGLLDWRQPTEGRLPGLGRGLIAGSWLIWPTTDADLPYRGVTLRDGQQQSDEETERERLLYEPTLLRSMPVGNLAFGQGCLAVAGLEELVVFVPPQKLPKMPGDLRPQARIETLYRQARALATAGATVKAASTYLDLLEATRLERKASDWRTLIEGRLQLLACQPPPAEMGPAAHDAFVKTFGDPRMPASARLSAPRDAVAPMPVAKAKMDNDRVPVALSSPALPLVRSWAETGGRVWPIHQDGPRDDLFFCTHENDVTCRTAEDGKLRWRQKLTFAPNWFGRWQDLVVLVGPDSAEARRMQDGERVWSYPAASRKLRIGRVANGAPRIVAGLRGFVRSELWGGTLLLLDDDRIFQRLRLDTGRVVWHYAAPDARLRPLDAAAFQPYVARVGQELLVQSISGQPALLGSKIVPLGEKSRLWPQAPVIVGDLVVVGGEKGRIDAYDVAAPHARRWTYQAPWPTSLTGELFRLNGNESVLLALVPRNDGLECVGLDVHKGVPLWSRRASELPNGLDAGSVCVGDMSFFYVRASTLCARSLNDGAVQWELTLPGQSSRWQVRYSKACLTVCAREELKGADFFVGFIDPWDGQWLQRLTFPGARSGGEMVFAGNQVIVSAPGGIFGFQGLDRK